MFSQRRVLVTGASSRLGYALASLLVEQGHLVYGTARKPGFSASLINSEIEKSGSFEFLPCDLSVDSDVDVFSQSLCATTPRLDGLVHIAGGVQKNGQLSSVPSEEWLRTYDINVVSLQRLLRRLLPIISAGQNPSIIIVGSTTAEEPGDYDPHYSAAKAALQNFSKHLSRHLAPAGVRVNYLVLGPTNSGWWATEFEDKPKTIKKFSKRIPLGRLGEPEEVAELISAMDSRYLWMTGSSIRIDGGKNRGL